MAIKANLLGIVSSQFKYSLIILHEFLALSRKLIKAKLIVEPFSYVVVIYINSTRFHIRIVMMIFCIPHTKSTA